jgi:hypothetical protein
MFRPPGPHGQQLIWAHLGFWLCHHLSQREENSYSQLPPRAHAVEPSLQPQSSPTAPARLWLPCSALAPVCTCTYLPLYLRLTLSLIATCPMSHWAGRRLCRLSTTFNRLVILQLPPLQPSLWFQLSLSLMMMTLSLSRLPLTSPNDLRRIALPRLI